MKILLLSHEYPPLSGGGAVFASNLAEVFVKKGHKVIVITSRPRGSPNYQTKNGVKIFRAYTPFRGKKGQTPIISILFYLIFGAYRLIVLSKNEQVDIVNTHFAFPAGLLGLAAKRLFKAKNVLYVLGRDIYDPTRNLFTHKNPLYRTLVSFVIRDADLVVAESNDIAKHATKLYNHSKRIRVVPVGFLPPDLKIRRSRKRSGTIKLVAIGRLVERKGFEYLINAVKGLEHVHLSVIGEGPEREKLKSLINRLNLRKNISLLGGVTENKKWEVLLNSDIYVLSSLHEGFGIVLQEAMYAGLPIISTNRGGQIDFLNKKNAILIKPKSYLALRKAIYFLSKRSARRSEMAKFNKKYVKQFYISKIANEHIKLFQKVLRT